MKCEYFTDFIQAHVEKSDPNRIYIDKLMTRKMVSECSVSLPEIYFEKDSIDDVDFSTLPDPVVLKLSNLASKRGVFILYRVRGGYFEQLRGRLMSQEEVVSLLKGVFKKNKSKVIAEELVQGENGPLEIPFDYKLFVFDGRVELVEQVNRNTPMDELAFFDGEFDPLEGGKVMVQKKHTKSGKHIRPKNCKELLRLAKGISIKINRPFIRVDVYTTGEKVYVGELTPTPGGAYFGNLFRFSDGFDKYLGGKMVSGYIKRGWTIPEIEKMPPARRKRVKNFI